MSEFQLTRIETTQGLKFRVGEVSVTRVVEKAFLMDPSRFMPKCTPEALERHASWLRPHFVSEDGRLKMSMHALVVESRGRTIVVDTCVGNDKSAPLPQITAATRFLEDFRAAGFDPLRVDYVLCTHLHVDHVGWNTMRVDGIWRPTFPNARYLFGRREWDYWRTQHDPMAVSILSESLRPVIDAGLVDLVESDHRLTDEVSLVPTPGHTPGHCSVLIRSRGSEGIITGDVLHHPVHVAEPDWGIGADASIEGATGARRDFVQRYGDRPVLVIGTHFHTPTAGHIVRGAQGWWFKV